MSKWTCPSCGRNRTTAFCPQCGEEPLRPRDLKVDDLAGQIFRAFSNIDGRLLRSFRTLLVRPGLLSTFYVAGQRRTHLGPLQLFLIANALFFTVQSLTRINIFASSLDSHLHHQDWSPFARSMVADRLASHHESLAGFALTFDRAAILNAKSMIILMALAFAPLLPLMFHRARRAFGAHVVFALHLYTLILLILCVALLIAEASLLIAGVGLDSPWIDIGLALAILVATGCYLWFAAGEFYGSRGPALIAKALLLAAAVGALGLGYRFAIFLITLYLA